MSIDTSTEKNNDEGDSRPNEWTRLLKGSLKSLITGVS